MRSIPDISTRSAMRRRGSPFTGVGVVLAKEAADYLSGARMWLLEALVFLTAIAAAYAAMRSIRATIGESPFLFLRLLTMAQDPLPSFIALLGFLIPLVAIALGFDAINGEFNRRTLSRVLAQPIYRDALLLGKFLAALGTWLLFSLFWAVVTPLAATLIAGPPETVFGPSLHYLQWQQGLDRLSPNTLYAEIALALLQPATRALGPVFYSQLQGALLGAPLPAAQSFILVWPQMTGLVAGMIVIFAIAYVVFQRQEIRALGLPRIKRRGPNGPPRAASDRSPAHANFALRPVG